MSLVFFLMIPRTPRSTLFPYTTLFRSSATSEELVAALSALVTAEARHQFLSAHPALVSPETVLRLKDLVLRQDRKSTRLNSSHANISYAVFCLKKKI